MAVKRLSAKPLFVCEGYLFGQPVHKQILKGMCCTTTPLIRWPWVLWEPEGNGSQIRVKLECLFYKASPRVTFGGNAGSSVPLVWPTGHFLCSFCFFLHQYQCGIFFIPFSRVPLMGFAGFKQHYQSCHFLSMCMTCFFKLALSRTEMPSNRSACYKTNPDPKQNRHLILCDPSAGWRTKEQTL